MKEKRKRKRWSWSVREYGRTVRVWEDLGSRRLYAKVAGQNKVALKDLPAGARDAAKRWAKQKAKAIRTEAEQPREEAIPTVKHVFALYLTHHTPRKGSPTSRAEDKRCVALWTRVLGADQDLHAITKAAWERFIDQRASGAIDARGQAVPEPGTPEDPPRRPVRNTAVGADLKWVRAVIRWAMTWNEPGPDGRLRYLMREDVTRGYEVPHEQNPRRPVTTQDRFEKILAVAPQVHPFLGPMLVLANGTGRRLTPIRTLRYQDLQLTKSPAAPHGAIAWPGETDKMGKAWAAPINAQVRAALDAYLAERPGVGAAYLFPSPTDPAKPMDRWFPAKLLHQAERLAKVPRQRGVAWHALRRKWATERKHLPIQDVARAGGWKSEVVPRTIYMQPDPATLYAVVSQPMELREVKEG